MSKGHTKTPSFSSMLLDSIYRSLDGDDDDNSTPTTQHSPVQKANKKDKSVNLTKAIMIEHWIEKQQQQQQPRVEKEDEIDKYQKLKYCVPSNRKTNRRSSTSEIRSSPSDTTSKSPRAKIAYFLNSIFSAKRKSNPQRSNSPSPCSSASSFSRSCLSKSTPTSSSKQRSVRFYPVSVIVGDDSRPCGHKCLYERAYSKPIRSAKSAKLTKIPNVGRWNPWYLPNKEEENNKSKERFKECDREDAESYASSDLFELADIRYGYEAELPVYGTTNLETNKAIANGFVV